ncbi:MAG: hypothetical protein K8R77_14860 [Anaerolineaceae bacterium]|nr:hypothetical protein [Anaerolineaceae bacterium]
MEITWFVIGITFACVYMWLQWLQIQKYVPGVSAPKLRLILNFCLRIALFAGIAILALHEDATYGLLLFLGFWVARSILLIAIGFVKEKKSSRSNS